MTIFLTVMTVLLQVKRQDSGATLLTIAGEAARAWALSMLLCSRLLKEIPQTE